MVTLAPTQPVSRESSSNPFRRDGDGIGIDLTYRTRWLLSSEFRYIPVFGKMKQRRNPQPRAIDLLPRNSILITIFLTLRKSQCHPQLRALDPAVICSVLCSVCSGITPYRMTSWRPVTSAGSIMHPLCRHPSLHQWLQ